MAGYIKIYRDVLDTVLFRKPVLLQMWLLLNKMARFVKTEQNGVEILPGQVLIAVPDIAKQCNLNERRVRYILDCLESMELIRRENIRNRYTLITIVNPDELRDIKQTALPEPHEHTHPNSEPLPQQTASVAKAGCGVFLNVYLSAEEKEKLQQRCSAAESYIDRLSAYKQRTQKKYNDDFAVLCEWISKDEISGCAKQEKPTSRYERNGNADISFSSPNRAQPYASKSTRTQISWYGDDYSATPASYDLEKAEYIARTTVPKFRKRKRPENETIGLL